MADNAEINALLKILGLQYKMKYDQDDHMKTLRYGKVMVMADQVRRKRERENEEEADGVL